MRQIINILLISKIFWPKGMSQTSRRSNSHQFRYIQLNSTKDIDQGWAWLIMVSSFFGCFITAGMCYTFGIYYMEYMKMFPESKFLISVMTSIPNALFLCLGPLSIYTSKTIGYHWTVALGCTFGVVGNLLSYLFKNDLRALVFTQGVMIGIGGGMLYSPLVCVLKLYFVRRYILATAFCLKGLACACIAFPFICNRILEHFGIAGSFLINAGIYLQIYVVAVILAYPVIGGTKKSDLSQNLNSQLDLDDEDTLERIKMGSVLSLLVGPPVIDHKIIDSIIEIESLEEEEKAKCNACHLADECDNHLKPKELPLPQMLKKSDKYSTYPNITKLGVTDSINKTHVQSIRNLDLPNHGNKVSYKNHVANTCKEANGINSLLENKLPTTKEVVQGIVKPPLIPVKSVKTILFMLYGTLEQMSSAVMLLMISDFARNLGIDLLKSSLLISYVGVGEFFGCLSIVIWGWYYAKSLSKQDRARHPYVQVDILPKHDSHLCHPNDRLFISTDLVAATTKVTTPTTNYCEQKCLTRFPCMFKNVGEIFAKISVVHTILFCLISLVAHSMISALLILDLSRHYYYFSCQMALFGYFYGARIAMFNALILDVYGSQNFYKLYSAYVFMAGLGCLLSLPLATWLSTTFKIPFGIFYLTTTSYVLCVLTFTTACINSFQFAKS